MFPGAGGEQKVKAMNYLLPHIRRIPEKLVRDQFAMDAAQKLGIDSAVLREELRQAALRRRDHVEVRLTALTEVERVLLRALAITNPEHEGARRAAVEAVTTQQMWFEGLSAFPALEALANRGSRDPMEVVVDQGQRALLAEALLGETEAPAEGVVRGAIQSLEQRRLEGQLRDIRAQIAEAERRSDFAELSLLTKKKLDLDKVLRQLKSGNPTGSSRMRSQAPRGK
jgi:DNA primase